MMDRAQRNEKILKAIAERTKQALTSKQAARQMLIDEGIYTKKGKLRAEFGGGKSGGVKSGGVKSGGVKAGGGKCVGSKGKKPVTA